MAVVATWVAAMVSTVQAEGPSVARLVFLTAKPGMKAQLEEAIKRQMDWRRDQKDDWRWVVWEYVSGGKWGRYAVATFGHRWEDFDHAKVTPWVEDVNQGALATLSATPPLVQYFDHLEEVSDEGATESPPAWVELLSYKLYFGKSAQFYGALRKFHEALSKAEWRLRYEWMELLNGGEIPSFLLILPRADWAAFETREEIFEKHLEKAYGRSETVALLDRFSSAVKSQHRSAARLRLDLSYVPTPPKSQ
jgi:hypothetical protein